MDDRLLERLAGEYGTPLYVYDGDLILERYDSFYSAFSKRFKKVKVCYAYKANTNLAVCSLLREEGAGADVVSVGELKTALKLGVSPEDIIYTSNSKSREDLEFAVDSKVVINVDSVDELETLGEIAGKGKAARVSFRVNPSINPKTHHKIATGLKESKFGLHIEKNVALEAYRKAKAMKNIKIVGVQTHIGSQIKDAGNFTEAAEKLFDFAVELKNKLKIELEFIDIGGGLGISYQGDKTIQPEELAKALEPIAKEGFTRLGYQPILVFEPGRYLVAESGVLLTRVNSVKETPYKKFVNVDCGFNTLMRPAMYEAYHRVKAVGKKGSESVYDISGNVCESGDILAKDRNLPKINKGDLIAILDAGAYGMSMASTYNSRPLPAEVLVRGKKIDLIRERGEQDDLYWNQRIPEDLQ